ncbi:MAG: GNAT family N-acetyltransferase [Dehalococcoidia bacterium]
MTTAIRAYLPTDDVVVAEVWHRSGRDRYTFLPTWQTFTLEQARDVFHQSIAPECELWVGTIDGRIVAFLAMKMSYIDRLYVEPSEQGNGWGRRLLEYAKDLHPAGLELHTHQENRGARRFYERNGFNAVRYGTSPPPESAPDVEYHWRPDEKASHSRHD